MAKVTGLKSSRGRPQFSRAFIDSNVLLYCDDSKDIAKQTRAIDLVVEHLTNASGVVSLQVLQEYFVNATRKFHVDSGLARRKLLAYARFELVEPATSDVFAAIDLHRLHQLSYWDAMVLHCAKKSGCKVLLTEDLQHGQVIDGVRIVNPFI